MFFHSAKARVGKLNPCKNLIGSISSTLHRPPRRPPSRVHINMCVFGREDLGRCRDRGQMASMPQRERLLTFLQLVVLRTGRFTRTPSPGFELPELGTVWRLCLQSCFPGRVRGSSFQFWSLCSRAFISKLLLLFRGIESEERTEGDSRKGAILKLKLSIAGCVAVE